MSVVLSEHLPLLASAPDGIQKLRGLILELAVRGKLVPQEPDRDQSTWKRGLFSDFFSLEYGDNLPAPKRTGTGEYPVYGSNGVVGTHNECRVLAPCIVVGRKGSAGALNLCREPGCWVTDVAYYCIPPNGVDLDFAFVLLRTLGLDDLGKGIKPGLSRSEAYSLSVEIPPLAEQHRIVAKVDELMALCDRLEAEQADAASAHARLVESLLGTLTQSTDATDLAANWQCLAEHFDALFTTEASIDALKQTILRLAVMGKLVPQDPNDEPASELLKRIGLERVRLEKEGVCKKSKPLPPVEEDERFFVAPGGWAWCRLQSAFDVRDGTHDSPKFLPHGVSFLTSKNIYGGQLNLVDLKFISESDHIEFSKRSKVDRDDILFAMIGSIGNPVIVDTDLEFSFKNMALFKYFSRELASPQYLKIFLSVISAEMKAKAAGGVQAFVALGTIRNQPIALPPLAEQHRIAAKVCELMTICDHLMADIASASQHQATLAVALIESALEAA